MDETFKFIPARPVVDRKPKNIKDKPVKEKPLEVIRLKRPLHKDHADR